ncbi:SMR family transporter [Pedomonas sp. V897]|uniref:SMR family transporter n=1 Tax=Pedomonas sp. V897 TaxID=3446482 RepID=UPI003EE33A71
MNLQVILLLVTSISLSSLAQVVLKLGAGSPAAAAVAGGMGARLLALLMSPLIVAGLILYGLSAIVWILVLSKVELSFAYPFVGLGFVLTMAVSALFLGEQINAARLAGTVIIAVGAVLVARSS